MRRSWGASPVKNSGSPSRSIHVRALLLSAISVSTLAFVIVTAHSVGRSSRALPARTVVVETGAELVAEAVEAETNGAVLLVASADLGYLPVMIPTPAEIMKWPVKKLDLNTFYRDESDRDSWAWVLAKTGLVRRIDYLLSESELRRKVVEGREMGFPGIADDARSISADDDGFRRYMASEPAALDEPLLLVVDASYFESGTQSELMDDLEGIDVRPRALIVYRALDDTSVPDAARAALDAATPALWELVAP